MSTFEETAAALEEMKAKIAELEAKQAGAVQYEGRAVLLTTSKRGVFFGYTDDHVGDSVVTLVGTRNCIYWVAGTGGFLGLASEGPGADCRIGAQLAGETAFPGDDITSISDCSDAATKVWNDAATYRG